MPVGQRIALVGAGLGAAGIAGHGRNPDARCAGTRHAPATRFAALHVLCDLSAALPGLRHDDVVGLAAAGRNRTCPGGQRGRHAPGRPEPGRRSVVVGFGASRTMVRRQAQPVDHGRHRGDGQPGDRRAMGVAIVDVLKSSFPEPAQIVCATRAAACVRPRLGIGEGITMDRRSLSLRWPAVVVSLALLSVVAVGCKSGLESVTLLWNGYDIPPEWDGLKGKKVAVVCKPLTSQEFSNSGRGPGPGRRNLRTPEGPHQGHPHHRSAEGRHAGR